MEITPNMTPEQYVDQLVQEDEALRSIREAIIGEGMPEVSVAHPYGKLLTFLIEVSGAGEVLEIGALGGYSGLCLARGLGEKGRIVSLELKKAYALLAHKHMEDNGYGDRVEYRIGPAVDSLKTLQEEGRTFDFFFIDADKENYPVYLEYAIALAKPGAIIAGDNCFLRGRTLNTDKNGPAVQAVRRFNEMIATDPRLVSTLLPAYDGLALARVK
ncbi:methyltransferase [Paenibacillus kribbensis]|uniref:Methyltransferase n=1 Tax=Paenibacillus kribbensis TaxID=172713 RepID=A0A222WR19_9BACL|nr:O-methyltransferase [Paenibacillus kribbensis]ASR48173.1 methyltransferase [Paenibacillus kribbensis]